MNGQRYDVIYKISLFPSKFVGRQSKSGTKGEVKLFVSNIWEDSKSFEDFVDNFIFILILERICLERGFQRIRMKSRCDPCKMELYALKMFELSR